MNTTEIMAATEVIKEIKKQLAVLEGLVGTAKESVKETPVIEEPQVVNEQPEELPAPPAEIIIPDTPEEDDSPTKEDKADSLLGWQILNSLPDFYKGRAKRVELQKPYYDNGKEKLYIDKYRVNIRVYDVNNILLGEVKKPFNALSKFHLELIKRGINKHKTSSNPKVNWMPYVVSLELL